MARRWLSGMEGFASEWQWKRAYQGINDFEERFADHGTAIVEFRLHIDRDEQLRRYKEREQSPYKRFKIARRTIGIGANGMPPNPRSETWSTAPAPISRSGR